MDEQKSTTIGIIGHGVIGSAVYNLFPRALIYDPYEKYMQKVAFESNFVFICVPTPCIESDGGMLDCRAVEESVSKVSSPDTIVVICSTVQPGTGDVLAERYNRKIVIQPEYYGESVGHPMTALSKQPFIILGGETADVSRLICLYQEVYNANIRIRRVTRMEAEVIKLSENRAIAYKVAACQELFDACKAADVDYELIRQAVYGDDPRFNLWWTFVYENKRGFDSKCIPKDVYAWTAWAKSIGADTSVVDALLKRNKELTRPNPKEKQ